MNQSTTPAMSKSMSKIMAGPLQDHSDIVLVDAAVIDVGEARR